ncbi:MAG: hypothetical protein AB7L84_10975 [Acidimicrobiia bacterium]
MRRALAALALSTTLGGLAVVGGPSPASAGVYEQLECWKSAINGLKVKIAGEVLEPLGTSGWDEAAVIIDRLCYKKR